MAVGGPLSRSEQMSRIRGRDTEPERRLRSDLWAAGLRYRIHAATPVGRPDVVFPNRHLAVFIDGCFWHGCPLHYVRPGNRGEVWAAKLRTNVERDRRQTLELESLEWRVLRVWEHEIYEEAQAVVQRVREALRAPAAVSSPDWRVVAVEVIDEEARTERRHLEELRNPDVTRTEEMRRVTAKWRRPKRT
jgi:DNA mismatch endonuclease, patch repair protein